MGWGCGEGLTGIGGKQDTIDLNDKTQHINTQNKTTKPTHKQTNNRKSHYPSTNKIKLQTHNPQAFVQAKKTRINS